MTIPDHNTSHMDSNYGKLNIVSVALIVITLIAALLAAVSGIQLHKLEKRRAAEISNALATPDPAAVAIQEELNKQIETLKSELTAEKAATKKLNTSIAKLKKHKSALQKSIATMKAAKPEPEAQPAAKSLPDPEKTSVPAQDATATPSTGAPAIPSSQPEPPIPQKPMMTQPALNEQTPETVPTAPQSGDAPNSTTQPDADRQPSGTIDKDEVKQPTAVPEVADPPVDPKPPVALPPKETPQPPETKQEEKKDAPPGKTTTPPVEKAPKKENKGE